MPVCDGVQCFFGTSCRYEGLCWARWLKLCVQAMRLQGPDCNLCTSNEPGVEVRSNRLTFRMYVTVKKYARCCRVGGWHLHAFAPCWARALNVLYTGPVCSFCAHAAGVRWFLVSLFCLGQDSWQHQVVLSFRQVYMLGNLLRHVICWHRRGVEIAGACLHPLACTWRQPLHQTM